ncbi:MAG: 2-oxoacid:acceptor oxidoreductase subunit alpha [Desulfomonile tiedjei]|uniref:2-oxoacid:acceptor oxidoreductase subunit alpha n=1 Tax=Desulfomonile tiedjei TaxID=2358 RepID=A0A9D6V767_9BACT|nr:2-oxoacid:acceptor oxidoreductase subunit alpha [Desulfomonile tiedjei]
MPKVDITVEVCGMAGDGTIAAGGLVNEAMSLGGFSVLGFDSYPAEIRGFGRCVTRSRIGSNEIGALADETHILISLDDLQSRSRVPFLARDSAVLFDSKPDTLLEEEQSLAAVVEPGTALFGIPFTYLATAATGTSRGRNLAALGGFAALFGVQPEWFRRVITRKFQSKGEKVLEVNLKSFDAGFHYALEKFADRLRPSFAAANVVAGPEKVMLSGNQAIGQAALDAGLKLYFGYPITPATPIMEFLAKYLPAKGGRVVQMEDEIASVGAVLGAFYAGARAMTATSGPGFALMTELITHGVMAEIPAVILNAQRGGPSTGLPTKTEQSDLHAAVFGGPGDSSRIVIAPSNVAECYSFTVQSFQLAEKYQTPVIVLTDFYLDNRVENVVMPVASEKEKTDGNLYPDESLQGSYHRYLDTESGVSPRSLPGMEGFAYVATGLEHTERAQPDYTPEIHTKMTGKRHRKLQYALEDLPVPVEYSDGGQLDVGIIGWGSTFGSIQEAVNMARERGWKVAALKITSIFPYHEKEIRSFMTKCREILITELNYEGQLANLIGHLHRKEVVRLNQVTGVPFSPSAIFSKIEALLQAGVS